MEKKVDELKRLAKQAKKRLSNGYWVKEKKKRAKCIINAQNTNTSMETLNKFYTNHLKQTIMPKTKEENEDSKLYNSLCKLLNEQGDNVVNPIAALLPHDELQNLPEQQRELFVIKFSEKIKALVKQYEKEKELKIV